MEIRSMGLCFAYAKTSDGRPMCSVLTANPTSAYCERCSFYKTKADFKADKEHAEKMLRDKGLEPCMVQDGRNNIMTVQRRDCYA